ncbi:hypothetical protein [Oceanirhabdus sp. W0125-5]|uniref:hypothetical protein n=1 Tax=Oceanirhabdus sp. W0125-5 TaxID=2999116 RepID=UPI0022F2C4E7|nr:hypothetical protein [Oceanirhabdus sp. W0125-5]WBW96216.1 hypothetical protein OW730_21365 [Oceanirhabdus sp. W0125-5]
MPSYRPGTRLVTSTVNASTTTAASLALSDWNRTIVIGTVTDGSGNLLTNAGVEVKRRASASGASTYLGVVFTDTNGEYGVSLPILSGTQVYAFEVTTPVS